MIDQTLEVTKLLNGLNSVGITTSKVEKEMPIASGYLYKVKIGDKTLGPDKLKWLQDYHANNCKKVVHQAPVIIYTLPKKNDPVIKEVKNPTIFIESTPDKKSDPKPGSLASMMKEINAETNRSVGTRYSRSKI